MTEVIICGIGGKMGGMLYEVSKGSSGIKIVAGVDKFCGCAYDFPVYASFDECREKYDAVIDFSRPDALDGILAYCIKNKTPAVLASTGYSAAQKNQIEKAAEIIPIFQSSNMSLGINLLCELVKKAALILGNDFDIEIIEKHHNKKVDAPSGTALTLANSINSVYGGSKQYVYGRHGASAKRTADEIGIHAIRGGSIAGEHDVMFIGNDEIITLSHTAASKQVFAEGAFKAAKFICKKPAGMYSMSDLFKLSI